MCSNPLVKLREFPIRYTPAREEADIFVQQKYLIMSFVTFNLTSSALNCYIY